jgi:hypothetical protein
LGIAARICSDLVLNGYTDWYLPSFLELETAVPLLPLLGNFNGAYCTSNEAPERPDIRIMVDEVCSWGTLLCRYMSQKNAVWSVRAMRSF